LRNFLTSKIKNIRDFYRGNNDFKKGYQPRTNIVKDEKGDLVAGSHSISARWRNHVRQKDINTAQPLVPQLSALEVELATEKLKSHKSPGIDQIPAEVMKAGSRTIHYEIHQLIISIWN